MALLTSHSTAAAITALLQRGSRTPSRKAFTPRETPRPNIHPWKVRYSTEKKTYLVYIPDGSVAGLALKRDELTEDEDQKGWYTFDSSKAEKPTVVKVYLYGQKVQFEKPEENATEKPSFEFIVAEVTDTTKETPPKKIKVTQRIFSAISLGGSGGTYYTAGPIAIETIEGVAYLVQPWVKFADGQFERVSEEGIPSEDKTPRMPSGVNSDSRYAVKIPLTAHAEDHAEGVVLCDPPPEE